MGRVARPILETIPVLLLASFGTYMLLALIPGDPAVTILGTGHPPADYVAIDKQLGVGRPILDRYFSWLHAALTGDFGHSLLPPNSSVVSTVGRALPVSAELVLMALVIAAVVSIPLALIASYRPRSFVDRAIDAGTYGILSVPSFLAGLLLILAFVKSVNLFPRAQWVDLSESLTGNLHHAILPALTVSLPEIAVFTKVLRNDMLATLDQDFILAARARGMPPWRVLIVDALRPSMLSLVTLLGVSLGTLIGGTVVVETIFSLPGLGTLIVQSAAAGDIPVVQGAVLVIAIAYVLVNALVDVSYGVIDPRLRRRRG